MAYDLFMKTSTLSTNCVHPALVRFALLLIPLLIYCIGLLPSAQAVSPAPDGAYAGGNTAEGQNSLLSLTTGMNNSGIGFEALQANTSGNYNTGIGVRTLWSNTIGSYNTASGAFALTFNTTGAYNVANGFHALYHNTTASYNTATGYQALFSNTTGNNNTANGYYALRNNTTGGANTANGYYALRNNTTGTYNTASGGYALYHNTTGWDNTASGDYALGDNTGTANTANGYAALAFNTTGDYNTANGSGALASNTTGSNNIALGFNAGEDIKGDDNIDIGNTGDFRDSDTIRIGYKQTALYIAGFSTVVGSPIYIDTNTGRLGILSSSERFKDAIEPMGDASEALLSLHPVKFRYKKGIDPKRAPQFGLVAEDVEKVNPNLVVRDKEGKPYTVRYDAVNAMLLNEFLKEHRKVEELQATLAEQQKSFESKLAGEQKQIDALTAGLQKVSAQLEVSKAAPQTVLNSQ